MSKYVISRGSAGRINAVKAIREIDFIRSITITILEEPFPQYSRLMTAEILTGEAAFKKIKFPGDHLWKKNQVNTESFEQNLSSSNRIEKKNMLLGN